MNLDVNKALRLEAKFGFLFSWLRFFYPKGVGIPLLYQLYFFVPQKIIRINGRVPWPVHFTSRILFAKNISVGNRSAPGMNAHCYIQARNGITIGNNVRIGPGVGIISASHDLDDYDSHKATPPIEIGSNVWIGMNAVILPGVTIGNNVAIGAGSIVVADIPDNSIAVGNPCKVIKTKPPYRGTPYDAAPFTGNPAPR
jgi:acetyltransferase-like isoleucine patch superfamily enzyme